MRKVTYGGASSLDFQIARPDGAVDWLMWSDEAGEIMNAYWATVDCMLMGRKTYEVAMKSGQGGADSMGGISTYVFSRTLEHVAPPAVLVRDNAADFVRALKAQPGKDICLMGGGELALSLFNEGLIDEVGFNMHPLLLGAGIPAVPPVARQVNLELIECRTFRNGCVYVLYRVRP